MTTPSTEQVPITMRQDGLVVGNPFLVIQVFDSEGYYSAKVGNCINEVRRKVSTIRISLIACSIPFAGSWHGNIPVVTAPWSSLEIHFQ